jgi:hypothetical protein
MLSLSSQNLRIGILTTHVKTDSDREKLAKHEFFPVGS